MFRDYEVQGFLHCSFVMLFCCCFSSFSFIIVLFHCYFVVTLSHCCQFVVVSSCCCSITLLLVHGYSILLFTYGSSLALLFVCGYSLALLLICHCVVIGPSLTHVTPSHSYYGYVVILSTSSTMPNPIPIRFVIVVTLCYCCSIVVSCVWLVPPQTICLWKQLWSVEFNQEALASFNSKHQVFFFFF